MSTSRQQAVSRCEKADFEEFSCGIGFGMGRAEAIYS